MAKVIPLETRSFGTEPGAPNPAAVAAWIREHRGTFADLYRYLLDTSLSPQLASGITFPSAGGLFCGERIRESLTGLNSDSMTAVSEIHAETSTWADEAAFLSAQKKDVWCAFPAPMSLGLSDRHYGDNDEWRDALSTVYRIIMRTMRDSGIGGHILICNTVDEQEISCLAGKKVFFFAPNPSSDDLEPLMEHQRQIAIGKKMLGTAMELASGYEINRWIIMEPDKMAISQALSHFDPDQLLAGGYCRDDCDNYWTKIVESAVYLK